MKKENKGHPENLQTLSHLLTPASLRVEGDNERLKCPLTRQCIYDTLISERMPQPCFFQTGSDSLGPAHAPSLYFVENGPADVAHTSLPHPKKPPLKKPSVPPHHGIQDSQLWPNQPYLQVGRTQERCQRGKK